MRFLCKPEFLSAPWLFTSPNSVFAIEDGARARAWRRRSEERGEVVMLGLLISTRDRDRDQDRRPAAREAPASAATASADSIP